MSDEIDMPTHCAWVSNGDQVEVQDCCVPPTQAPEFLNVGRRHSPRLPRQLGRVIEHGPLHCTNGRVGIVVDQILYKTIVLDDPAETFRMMSNSIVTMVDD